MSEKEILLVLTERMYESVEAGGYLEGISDFSFKVEKIPVEFPKNAFFINEFKAMEILLEKPLKDYRGIVIGCFFDPCVEFLRMRKLRVIGCGEASMILASVLERNFGVISCFKETVPRVRLMVKRLGLSGRFVGISIVDGDEDSLIEGGKRLVEEGADSLIVAHVPSIRLIRAFSKRFKGARVVEPLRAGLYLANAMF